MQNLCNHIFYIFLHLHLTHLFYKRDGDFCKEQELTTKSVLQEFNTCTCKQAPQPTAWIAAGWESKAGFLCGQSYSQQPASTADN